ncbi:NAD(P)/FAD-dependent oxidoreductase [Pseudosulfitobacter pseudonitzschiae]|uniref:NAD(P)/FAD-dependent oxidoreductase n=1 Tax=Pseudosulfitobacter pseudonitzschiae TaxID=1402135 RepID=UPI001AFA0FDF|nr:FAD-dependent oxidoreductase [Pseudosulfitobacter pseudonitzschiae]MBM1816443.1 FAD-dependent oxidoreductase [Pseudosulfitobacter pseudonitzschiae]MBM1833041.1 FAD-dependent oxidoreductase [Pseudosulfitobacter pseudonitzschiae]MBM1837909.1 FAD-dependent oxidoreductase [Pseudosulfitobacter pseudonitzschiae]MBM1843170.1 FAD-dependent oxidoreductase [Pseudosulfitobacter pseudonitzschiae]MBM1848036.1 FAD-dependent oxidoreductase [Pseudosulfitobacter pseudonitzschiae]
MPDITIRGAGIFGLATAWACVQKGATVRVIDPNGPASGASGGIVGALAPHVPENWNPKKQFQLESLLMAESFWRGVSDAGGRHSCYIRSGRLQPVADDHALALAQSRIETARTLWHGQASWTLRPASGSPWEPDSATGQLIHDDLSAHLHPAQACAALVGALEARGVTVDPDGASDGPTLWATGIVGLQELNKTASRPMGAGVKGQAALLQYDMAGAPQLYADGLHIVPHADGTTAIGSTSENQYDHLQPDGKLDDIIARARLAVPALAHAPVIGRWAGVRPRARSRAPMLGAWPDRPGHYIANGGFKIGFGMAPKVAETMAALILEGDNTIPTGFEVNASA